MKRCQLLLGVTCFCEVSVRIELTTHKKGLSIKV